MHIGLIAEADSEVGFGHLAEITAVAAGFESHGVRTRCLAIGSAPEVSHWERVEWLRDWRQLSSTLQSANFTVAVWSARRSLWNTCWPELARSAARHVWMMDTPGGHPNVDVLINPTLSDFLSNREAAVVLQGPQYFPLIPRMRSKCIPLNERSRNVLLTLGGADRTQATLRLLPALTKSSSTVVIGPGFKHRKEVQRTAGDLGVATEIAPANLFELLASHRIVISAGGNTLYEAAAMGTPALVAWEDPHEERQGKTFVSAGTARLLGRGADVDPGDVERAIDRLLGSAELQTMSDAALHLVDGGGVDRICNATLRLIHADRNLAAQDQ